jgi:mannitol/fructose-specific phosphotransferase system IIA component (Ntr-type)
VPQILSIVVFSVLIVDMGTEALLVVGALILLALVLYLFRRSAAAGRDYALLHLVQRITNRQVAGSNLEGELRDILHDVNDVQLDSFDMVVQQADVIDVREALLRSEAFERIAVPLSQRTGLSAEECVRLLEEREELASTAISPFIAVPHIVLDQESFGLIMLRCRDGVAFAPGAEAVHAVFVLYGAMSERTRHLQALAAIAQVANEAGFEEAWLRARSVENLRDLVLLSNRRRLSPVRSPGP